MADDRPRSEDAPGHDLDQEWGELVEEHRLAMPGIQVLFAFLLILPFQNRFEELTQNQVYVYFSALVGAAIAIVLLISPTAVHRIRWRQQDKEALLQLATRTAIAATVFIAASMTASVYLVTDVLFSASVTVPVTVVLAAAFAGFWYVLPLVRRARDRARS
ncbi:MAG: DUF6328 family protein [Gaiellaceae bacterium]